MFNRCVCGGGTGETYKDEMQSFPRKYSSSESQTHDRNEIPTLNTEGISISYNTYVISIILLVITYKGHQKLDAIELVHKISFFYNFIGRNVKKP